MNPFSAYQLSAPQRSYGERVVSWAREVIAPYAAEFDEQQSVPRHVLHAAAEAGFTGANVESKYGGRPADNICIGLLHQVIGCHSTSVRSLLTVHGMVCEVLRRWGTSSQRETWLPRLSSGSALGAFALSEPEAGSDARAILTTARRKDGVYCLTGKKSWVTGGAIADVFLVIAKSEDGVTAFLVTPDTRGFKRTALHGMLGQRAAMLAALDLRECEIPSDQRIGRAGFGGEGVVGTALDFGRYTVAWGCVGIGQGCLELCMRHAAERRQFERPIAEHQLVRAMLTDILAGVRGCGLMCLHAGWLRDSGDPESLRETCLAKYAGARMCAQAASSAVQITGAYGCTAEHSAQRHYRDAKIMEIIEGSTQIQQDLIARLAYDTFE